MTYTCAERRRAAAWKSATETLPAAAKASAPYRGKAGADGRTPCAFCLPAERADLDLLPEVRDAALGQMVADAGPVQRPFGGSSAREVWQDGGAA